MHEILGVPAADRHIPLDVRRAVIARDGLTCQLCGCEVTLETLHIDHVVHWASGGDHTVDNLRVTCAPCNLRRPSPPFVSRRIVRGAPRPHWLPPLSGAAMRRHHRKLVAAGRAEPRVPDSVRCGALARTIEHAERLSARQGLAFRKAR